MMFDNTDCPFDPNDIISIKISLPSDNIQLGIIMKSDIINGLPFIQSTTFNSPAFCQLIPGCRSNMYILTINNHDQFSAQAAALFIKDLQREKNKYMTLQLVKRNNVGTSTSLVLHRTIFDQVPSLIPTNPVIATFDHQGPSTFMEFVTSATKPPVPSSFFDALKSPF